MEQDRIDAAQRQKNVPKRYADADLDDVDGVPETINVNGKPEPVRAKYTQAANRLKSLANSGGIVALLGPRGPGKTHMACGLVNQFCACGWWGRYMTAMDYIQAVRATWGKDSTTTQDKLVNEFSRLKLLVLDEMHERAETVNEDQLLIRIIDKRYANALPTILISNQDAKTFAERIGESVTNRIFDGGGKIVCDWPSLRGKVLVRQ